MKKLLPKTTQRLKNVGLLIAYWFLFVALPFRMCMVAAKNFNCSDLRSDRTTFYIFFILLLISPILLIIPYKMAKFIDRNEKMIFIILGLASSLVMIFYTVLIDGFACFGPSF